jgi:hypothetical protein
MIVNLKAGKCKSKVSRQNGELNQQQQEDVLMRIMSQK